MWLIKSEHYSLIKTDLISACSKLNKISCLEINYSEQDNHDAYIWMESYFIKYRTAASNRNLKK